LQKKKKVELKGSDDKKRREKKKGAEKGARKLRNKEGKLPGQAMTHTCYFQIAFLPTTTPLPRGDCQKQTKEEPKKIAL